MSVGRRYRSAVPDADASPASPLLPAPPTRADVARALSAFDPGLIAGARWFGAKGRAIVDVDLDEAFVLDEAGPHVLATVHLALDDRTTQRYAFALTGAPLREAAPGDGTWRALAVAMGEGRTIPALGRTPDDPGATVTAALVCRPGPAIEAGLAGATERDLGADQSNTSVVLGERLLLKAYRRLWPGLNPDLEMTAFLSEDAGFAAVPRIAGFAELVSAAAGTSTVAMLQEFVADGADAFESIAEALAAWILAPGEVSLEVATEIAADLGSLTAGLHAAVADGHGIDEMAPREATRAEVRSWSRAAHEHLATALEVSTGDAAATLVDLAPRIAEALTIIDAIPTTPQVVRAHGDFHLGQVLIAPDGFRVIDFEGEPLSPPDTRRSHRPALRDVASMLRSIDHVGRSAARRATDRADASADRPGLDVSAWMLRGA